MSREAVAKRDATAFEAELRGKGYDVDKMVEYANSRFVFVNYRPDVVREIMGKFGIPYADANMVSIIALQKEGHYD